LLIPALEPLHQKLPPPRPGDWLDTHPEKGQDFKDYLRSNPITLTTPRTVLYVLPLGDFSPRQRDIVSLSAEFLGMYFSCKVVTLETLSVDDWIPQAAKRVHPSWGVPQIKSTFVLDALLPPRVPADGVIDTTIARPISSQFASRGRCGLDRAKPAVKLVLVTAIERPLPPQRRVSFEESDRDNLECGRAGGRFRALRFLGGQQHCSDHFARTGDLQSVRLGPRAIQWSSCL